MGMKCRDTGVLALCSQREKRRGGGDALCERNPRKRGNSYDDLLSKSAYSVEFVIQILKKAAKSASEAEGRRGEAWAGTFRP